MRVVEGARPCEDSDQIWRHHCATDPHGRKDCFAKRPNVNHATALIETLQRSERATSITKLAVVIILDNPRVACPRPFEQCQTPRQAHRNAKRVLVRRRDVNEFRLLFCGGKIKAFGVYGNGNYFRADGGKCASRFLITWVFNQY